MTKKMTWSEAIQALNQGREIKLAMAEDNDKRIEARAVQLDQAASNPGWCKGCTPDNCHGCEGRYTGVDGFEQPAPVPQEPHKMPTPPGQAPITDVCYAEGWNACCDAFFNGLPPPEPLIVTVTQKVSILQKPLPSYEIVTMYDEHPTSDSDMIEFARAIEHAHGIY